MSEVTEAAIEGVAQVAETVAGEATTVAEISRGLSAHEIRLVAAGVGVGLVVGGIVAYKVASKRLEARFEEKIETEIKKMREHFHAKEEARKSEEGKPALADLKGVVADAGYVHVSPSLLEDAPGPITREAATPDGIAAAVAANEATRQNAFDQREPLNDTWDQEHEENSRVEGKPFVIHVNERGATGFTETTFTYYAGDDVLADEQDRMLGDVEQLLGAHNLDRFGHGSGDRNVVYVRNSKLEVDIEVVRSEGEYAQEVAGVKPEPEAELRHSQRRHNWDG